MGRYVCSVCGYIYDPAVGDPENNIAPGTAFEDLPGFVRCVERPRTSLNQRHDAICCAQFQNNEKIPCHWQRRSGNDGC